MSQNDQALKENNKTHYGWLHGSYQQGNGVFGSDVPLRGHRHWVRTGQCTHDGPGFPLVFKNTRGRAAGIMLSGNGIAIVQVLRRPCLPFQ